MELQKMLQECFGVKDLDNILHNRIIMLGVIPAVFQQCYGINVIFNFTEEIFTSARYGISGTLFNIT
jgi:SP family sugar porter-like MFS transporter